MLKAIGVLLNLGVIGYLGYLAYTCITPSQATYLDIAQNPFVMCLVAVVGLFLATTK